MHSRARSQPRRHGCPVIGAELNAALAETGATALKGEIYTGPYTDQLEVEEPQPGEDVEPVLQREGPQL